MKQGALIIFVSISISVLLAELWTNIAVAIENNPVQGVHQDILSEMEEEEPKILPQVEILWRHTLVKNPTLQLAIQKIGEKTGQIKLKEKTHWTNRMLGSLIQIGGMGGAVATGSPAPLVGSTVLGRITASDKVASQLTAVNSSDMVILAKEIEQAQSLLILNYLKYTHAGEAIKRVQKDLDELHNQAKKIAQDSPRLTDTLNAHLIQQTFKLEEVQNQFRTYRHLLILSAGEEGVAEIDKLVNNESHTL